MFKVELIDAMNYLRQRIETERPTMLVRGIVNETLRPGLKIFVWDGPHGNAQRRNIYPAYKSKRPPARTDIYKSLELLRKILGHTTAWQARLPNYEGDDLIAALVKQFPNDPIQIVSTDRDMLALTDGHRVTGTAKPFTKVNVPYHFIRLYKLAVGDVSDCIPGIRGFGDKGWAACDKLALADALDKVMAGARPSDGQLQAAQLGFQTRNWLARPEAAADLLAMKTIIAPLPISPELVEQSLWKGVDNPEAREALMKEFFL